MEITREEYKKIIEDMLKSLQANKVDVCQKKIGIQSKIDGLLYQRNRFTQNAETIDFLDKNISFINSLDLSELEDWQKASWDENIQQVQAIKPELLDVRNDIEQKLKQHWQELKTADDILQKLDAVIDEYLVLLRK
ncbi:hypothetical protein [Lactococcus allomyrinae]|uniref:Uncharacterized protein n=1 Tax=Lactococcus allomyrinae TaxID=2419773 RepID=A0A387BE42_9LACT|nr:hypothetical protein [Lactococcus allomyrinae]AYF99868.1 hypothetical protein D7I46_01475 [Lactococcus allomyrinae]